VPISPTLFGIMADGLPRFLAHLCPTVGIKLPDGTCLHVLRIQVLGYADDFVLIASTIEDLQQLVDATQKWCELMGMSVKWSENSISLC
jgi:hypothetical protein